MTIIGATPVVGVIGNALDFNDGNYYASRAATATFTPGELGLSTWVKRTAGQNAWVYALAHNSVTARTAYVAVYGTGEVEVTYGYDAANFRQAVSTTQMALGSYIHLAVNVSDAGYEIFLGDVSVPFTLTGGAVGVEHWPKPEDVYNTVAMGGLIRNAPIYGNHAQDETRIFNRIFTRSEVTALFAEGPPQ